MTNIKKLDKIGATIERIMGEVKVMLDANKEELEGFTECQKFSEKYRVLNESGVALRGVYDSLEVVTFNLETARE